MTLSAVNNYNESLDFVIQKSNQPLDKIFSTGIYLILNLGPSDTLHCTSSTGYFTSRFGCTSIGIFNIAKLMLSDAPVSSVALDYTLASNTVTFDRILVNQHFYYDALINWFTARTGIYFFTLSVDVPAPAAESPGEFMLYLNKVPFTTIIHQLTGIDVIGRSIMIYLNESDIIWFITSLH